MIEEFGKMMKESESRIAAKFPKLETKLQEHDSHLSEMKKRTENSIELIKLRTEKSIDELKD